MCASWALTRAMWVSLVEVSPASVGRSKHILVRAYLVHSEKAKRASAPFHYAVNGRTDTMSATFPKNGLKAIVVGWGNPFEQHNVANWLQQARESGELECVICFEFQHTKTVDNSDVAFAFGELVRKTELVITPLHPWVQLFNLWLTLPVKRAQKFGPVKN